eukprot:TRINITY_DN61678_c0_g1_i1.p1 TRINITY_DN61678_c0_g1~~TRINITY_DN61678_c0_g1_i1.p1  ORF type:complete len:590 (+),score=20.82 TRINITY_DN61678_c0_g1_i1:31-1800(+)
MADGDPVALFLQLPADTFGTIADYLQTNALAHTCTTLWHYLTGCRFMHISTNSLRGLLSQLQTVLALPEVEAENPVRYLSFHAKAGWCNKTWLSDLLNTPNGSTETPTVTKLWGFSFSLPPNCDICHLKADNATALCSWLSEQWLKPNKWRLTNLTLELGGLPFVTDKILHSLMLPLPPNLITLDLGLSRTATSHLGEFLSSLGCCQLRALKLTVSWTKDWDQTAATQIVNSCSGLTELRSLTVDLTGCRLEKLPQFDVQFPFLREFELEFAHNSFAEAERNTLPDLLAPLDKLEALSVNFRDTTTPAQGTYIDTAYRLLQGRTTLKHFKYYSCHCSKAFDTKPFRPSSEDFPKLRSLTLDTSKGGFGFTSDSLNSVGLNDLFRLVKLCSSPELTHLAVSFAIKITEDHQYNFKGLSAEDPWIAASISELTFYVHCNEAEKILPSRLHVLQSPEKLKVLDLTVTAGPTTRGVGSVDFILELIEYHSATLETLRLNISRMPTLEDGQLQFVEGLGPTLLKCNRLEHLSLRLFEESMVGVPLAKALLEMCQAPYRLATLHTTLHMSSKSAPEEWLQLQELHEGVTLVPPLL